jgi:anti-sigma factor RsiW
MIPSREELAAFADGELHGTRAAEIKTAVAVDPALAAQLAAHRALKARLASHFAPILDEPVPERLTGALAPKAGVVDFAAAHERRQQARNLPRWIWIAAPALAASLVVAVLVPRGESDGGYATGQLAVALDSQLVATQPSDAPTRVLLSFRDQGGRRRALGHRLS